MTVRLLFSPLTTSDAHLHTFFSKTRENDGSPFELFRSTPEAEIPGLRKASLSYKRLAVGHIGR